VTPSSIARSPVLVTGEFVYDREAPKEWTQALRDISPISEDRGWLELVWESGDPWCPVQRWELYEMVHPSVIDPMELFALRGANPRATGHPCTSLPISSWAARPAADYQPCHCREKTEAWRDSESMVSLTEWKLFQRTGYIGRPFWVIQGTTGGNKVGFTHEEGLLLEAEGYPPIAPPGGSLPYAPFDQRVVRQITRFNRLWQFKNNIQEYRESMGPGYERYRKGVDKELRKQLVAHLKEQMHDVAEDFIRAADLGELDNVARTEIDYDRLDQMNDEHFVETGKILHHSNI
jgi:hypothetical protein